MVRKDIQVMQQIVRDSVERTAFNKQFKTITLVTLEDFLNCSGSFRDIVEQVKTLCKEVQIKDMDVAFMLCFSGSVLLVTTTYESWFVSEYSDYVKRPQLGTLAYVQKLFFDACGPHANHAKHMTKVRGGIATLNHVLSQRHREHVMSKETV